MRPTYLAALLIIVQSAQASPERFYLGTYTRESASDGIYTATFDSETGEIDGLELAAEANNPNYLALSPDGKTLYAVGESDGPAVMAFSVSDEGKLTALNSQPSGGGGACFVSVHPSGSPVFVANYGTGTLSAFPIEADGTLGEQLGSVQLEGSGPNAKRQKQPHAHSIYPMGDFVVACDLGTDDVPVFRLEDGELVPADGEFAKVPAGGGPRHLAFSRDGKTAYVANEMGLSVTIFDVDTANGKLTARETVPTHGEADSALTLAAIKTDPTGKWVTVSSRGDDVFVVFRVTESGGLEEIQRVSAAVEAPRDFSYDPSGKWLLSAGQNDHRVVVFSVDPENGKLTATDETVSVGKPVCVVFE